MVSIKFASRLGAAADRLGYSRMTLWRWCTAAHSADEEVRRTSPLRPDECRKIGREWRINNEAISRLLSSPPAPMLGMDLRPTFPTEPIKGELTPTQLGVRDAGLR
ncbi:MAG: hypothetical protein ACYDBB_26525 [Armatimonadota bacterium]